MQEKQLLVAFMFFANVQGYRKQNNDITIVSQEDGQHHLQCTLLSQ